MAKYWNTQGNNHNMMLWSLKPEHMKLKPDGDRYFRVLITRKAGIVVNFEQNEMPANPIIPIEAWLELMTLTQEWISANA